MALLKDLEAAALGSTHDLSEVLDALRYNDQGLIPAIAQDHETKEVLMLAWMNRTSIEATLSDGWVTYFSRSRNELWRKGESSGHRQTLKSMRFDCDGDAILMGVTQEGPACHTNRPNCFYLRVEDDNIVIESNPTD